MVGVKDTSGSLPPRPEFAASVAAVFRSFPPPMKSNLFGQSLIP